MSNKIGYILAFLLGAGVGGFATYKVVKKSVEEIAREEINSIKEAYGVKRDEIDKSVEELAQLAKQKPDLKEYVKRIEETGYTDYSKLSEKEESEVKYERPMEENVSEDDMKPYIITPAQFGEDEEEYAPISLTYYFGDQILADDRDIVMDDVENTVGLGFETHFGEYENDSVFVRNPRLKVDYEILLDYGKYSDVVEANPHLLEV